jgi:hypothetical protein
VTTVTGAFFQKWNQSASLRGQPKHEPLHQLLPLVEFSFDATARSKYSRDYEPDLASCSLTFVTPENLVPKPR